MAKIFRLLGADQGVLRKSRIFRPSNGAAGENPPSRRLNSHLDILQQAGNKGLDNKDYDGERWPARVKALSAASSKDETGLVNFDVAMTVSGMRYASDLHLGKVDPRTLHTDFEPERNEYDLCDFLLKHVVPKQPTSMTPSRSANRHILVINARCRPCRSI